MEQALAICPVTKPDNLWKGNYPLWEECEKQKQSRKCIWRAIGSLTGQARSFFYAWFVEQKLNVNRWRDFMPVFISGQDLQELEWLTYPSSTNMTTSASLFAYHQTRQSKFRVQILIHAILCKSCEMALTFLYKVSEEIVLCRDSVTQVAEMV